MPEIKHSHPRYILWFSEISLSDVPRVGGKNASLGELFRELTPQGVRVPNGFALSADAYWRFLAESHLEAEIQSHIAHWQPGDSASLRETGRAIRSAILESEIPSDIREEILAAYHQLTEGEKLPIGVAVRSSATAEDLPQASFAGQQETYLNVRGDQPLLDACKRCFASLFTDRGISYRHDQGFDHLKVALSIGIQRMVRSDLACSGVMFSIDTETGFPDAVLINSSYGLGENIVQGSVNPDEITVFKTTLIKGFRPILEKRIGNKEFKLVYDVGGSKMVKNVPVPPEDRARISLSDNDILTLARWACLIEQHYSKSYGHLAPMDMEWAKDGITGELFVVQARPETVQSRKPKTEGWVEQYELKAKGRVLAEGRSVGEKIASGAARIIKNVQDLGLLQKGEILVTDKTDPDWEPAMKRAAGVVTNRGGRTCHAAIVSRELGLPAIVGTENGTEVIRTGQMITVSCAEGETGKVYDGKLEYRVDRLNLAELQRPKTKIMMNLGSPDEAFRLSFIPNDGVGLAREEFIITSSIKIHPLALLHFDELQDSGAKAEIERLTQGYPDKSRYFVDRLAEGVAMIAAAFYPKDVIVRMSDFKTNEYANLIGGRAFEPKEENPMLGFRGASRYYDPRYREGFALECDAMKKARDEMGLTNIKLMIPFCRTLEEARQVIREMEKSGLRRGENGLELYVMCEIPSNVILAEEFCEVFDGFSIGSNDLTQLLLGVDRDSEIVAHVFDERNPAVTRMISRVIEIARRKGRKIGICGQAPSDYPDFARFLVREGIDSISLNPDAVAKTTLSIIKTEAELRKIA